MHILETHDLSHRFTEGDAVLNDINIQVEQGSIYGFLGPNGAGKTTTLRLILGLLKKQKGSISIFGRRFDKERVEILKNIGSLIESPSIYGHLTAQENLVLLQKIYRCPASRIPEVLEFAGLAHTGNKKAGQFSLGMKQRLSIAIALLHSPPLLLLDEPTNGLDPNGIIEIRELLRKLNRDSGTTIVVSSHLLSEIERLVTHLGIIHKGRMLFQGTLEELKRKQQQSLSVVIDTSDPVRTGALLADEGQDAVFADGKHILPALDREVIARLNRRLIESGIKVFEINVVKNDLESIFIDMVNN